MATFNTRNLRDGVVTFKSTTVGATAVHQTIALDEGDLSWTQTQNVIEVMDRGALSHIRAGDQAAMDISFTLKYQNLQADTATTPYEAIRGVGAAASWKSTDSSDVYTISTFFQVFNTSGGTAETSLEETLRFDNTYWTSLEYSDGDEYSTLAVTARSFTTAPTIT